MNRERLLAVADDIEAHPENFNMGYWCGSVCCIAGYAYRVCDTPHGAIVSSAAQWLELTPEQHMALFLPDEEIVGALEEVEPAVAVEVIRNFAEIGVVNWPKLSYAVPDGSAEYALYEGKEDDE